MKVSKFVSALFGVLGILLLVGSVALCLLGLDADPVGTVPEEAKTCAQQVMEALGNGDFAVAAQNMYGQPDLGTGRELSGEAGAVWEIFCQGIRWEFTSDFSISGTDYQVDARMTVPQIPSITASLGTQVRELMNQRIAEAEEMTDLYDEDNNFRSDLIEDVLTQAFARALAQEPETMTVDTTLRLTRQDGRWYVVPDAALLRALSGGLA